MTQDELIDMWHKAWPDKGSFVRASAQDLEAFAKLVEEKTKARANKAWTLFCIDMVNAEREACAQDMQPMLRDMISRGQAAEIIRARGNP